MYLVPLEQGQTVRINNIFFNTGEYELLQESFAELERLVKILKENSTIKIKLLGHTDNVGSREDNLILSKDRANSVKTFLINNGITEDRIVTQGFGFSKPIATNKTEEGRAKNRRVEFNIVEK